MTMSEDPQILDEDRRAFVAAMLQKMPESLSQAMLSEESIRAALGLPAGESLSFFNARFEPSAVMTSLRAVANGAKPELRSINGMVSIEEVRLDSAGSAVMISGDQGVRFAFAGVLSGDVEVRRRTLEAVLRAEDLEPEDEARMERAVEAGPFTEDLFVELERLVESTPKAVYRSLAFEAAEGVTLEALVPSDEQFFEALIGFAPPATMGEYRAGWLARAASFDSSRRVRWIDRTAPLSILKGALVAKAAQHLNREAKLQLSISLAGAPDPLSRLAAFELAASESVDPDFKAIGDRVLQELLELDHEQTGATLSFLTSAIILTSTLSTRRGTLRHWPIYARRLACYLHASMLTRLFRDGATAGEMRELVEPLEGKFRLVELCDARLAPVNQWGGISPARLHSAIVARVSRTVGDLPEGSRPQEWAEAVDAASSDASARPDALFQLVAGPLDPFEDDWAGLHELTDEMVDETLGRLETGEDDERALSDLIKIAVAFEVEPTRRAEFVERVPAFLERLSDETFTRAADFSLQVAARWKLTVLAERTINLALSKKKEGTAMDPSAPVRFGLLGGASNVDAEVCAKKVGEYFRSFAFIAKPGIEVENMLAAVNLIENFAPSFRPSLASARSFLLLAHNLAWSK